MDLLKKISGINSENSYFYQNLQRNLSVKSLNLKNKYKEDIYFTCRDNFGRMLLINYRTKGF